MVRRVHKYADGGKVVPRQVRKTTLGQDIRESVGSAMQLSSGMAGRTSRTLKNRGRQIDAQVDRATRSGKVK